MPGFLRRHAPIAPAYAPHALSLPNFTRRIRSRTMRALRSIRRFGRSGRQRSGPGRVLAGYLGYLMGYEIEMFKTWLN